MKQRWALAQFTETANCLGTPEIVGVFDAPEQAESLAQSTYETAAQATPMIPYSFLIIPVMYIPPKGIKGYPDFDTAAPGIPGQFTVTSPSAGEVVAQWSVPAWDGGSSVTGYSLNAYNQADNLGLPGTPESPLSASTFSYTWTGITSGEQVVVQLSSLNLVGSSTGLQGSVTVS
jgi:hypothetical protein